MKRKLRTFARFPGSATCPICGKSFQGKCILLRIHGTEKDGIMEAQPTHLNCLIEGIDRMQFHKGIGVIYLKV